ncbi:hypothetical protein GCM10022254_00180 [Actinomadura meridiana]|uniref:Uncharacterized protein n=1 Tax=Actinomadura meridiana TaxID=559626 RepID=A0ABP8BR21_9ACTN
MVLCHGVLMYLTDPAALIASLCACTGDGGILSIMALNADTLAVRPALERRWGDALAAFDSCEERGVLGVETRADTVAELAERIQSHDVAVIAWYGVWLFSDWMSLDATADEDIAAIAEVELEASKRDPYRSLSRVFHLLGRKSVGGDISH